MDADVSSAAEMVAPGVPEEQEVKGSLALVRVKTGPQAVSMHVFLGGPKEEEEVH
jgi:hypothetical protein